MIGPGPSTHNYRGFDLHITRLGVDVSFKTRFIAQKVSLEYAIRLCDEMVHRRTQRIRALESHEQRRGRRSQQ